MSRKAFRGFKALLPLAIVAALATTSSAVSKSKRKEAKPVPKSENAPENSGTADKPAQLGIYGDWGVYFAKGEKSKTCYALATPKDRAPSGLNRDPAYIFISSRPGENVREEISVIMGFPLKEEGAHAEVSGTSFALIAKGANAWIKNTAEEAHFVEALKKGSKLIVKAASTKGNVTTDSYSLVGLSQALEKLENECP
jgi:invasion protein IalB